MRNNNGTQFARHVDEIRAFADDQSPDVRDEIAMRIGYLWNADKTPLWDLAEGFANRDTNARVLVRLMNFLKRVSNLEPERIGALTQTLLQRGNIEQCEGRDIFHESIGTLVFHFWTRHAQTGARETIDRWMTDRITFKAELQHGAFSISAESDICKVGVTLSPGAV